VQAGQGFGSSLEARDLAENRVLGYGGAVTLVGLISNVPPTVLITEVETIQTERVEVANLSSAPVNISGWQLIFYDSQTWPTPKVTLTIPQGTVCPVGGLFQAHSLGAYPGVYPSFNLGVQLYWGPSSSFPYTAVVLLDANGRPIDFFCAGQALPSLISQPRTITQAEWSGLPVAGNQNQNLTYQRIGFFDHQTANDWISTNNSFMALNPGLGMPFLASPTKIVVTPGTVTLSNGLWAGEVTVTQVATNLILRADDLQGHAGDSSSLLVLSPPPLQIQVPPQAFEATAGFVGFGQVGITNTRSANLNIALSSSDTNEIIVPAIVTIFAGSTNGIFSITNVDDNVLDGPKAVKITATAPGFASAAGFITNYEIGAATLSLQMPGNVREGDGANTNNLVVVNAAAVTDIAVHLASSNTNKVAVPDSVIIPAGSYSNRFSIQVLDNRSIDGPQTVSITANVPFWAGGQATILVADNETTNLSIVLPSQVAEGSGSLTNVAFVFISGTVQTNVTVNLSNNLPTRFQIPPSVVIPAGQTSITFTVTVPDDSQMQGNQTVTVTGLAAGFAAAQASAVITDNDVQSFGFSAIPSPQYLSQGFPVSIYAKAIDGQTIFGFSGPALLGVSNGIMSPPALQVFLTNGIWSGSITLTNGSTNIVLTASGQGGLSGQSNPFRIVRPAIRQISLVTRDLVADRSSERLFATVPATGGAMSNSLVRLDPRSGAIENVTYVGQDPNKLAASDGGEYLYIGLDGESTVRRFDLGPQVLGPAFSIGSGLYALDLEVMPGAPDVVAVSRSQFAPFGPVGIAIYDHGLKRTNEFADAHVIAFGSSSILYGYHNYDTAFTFYRMSVSSDGVNLLNYSSPLIGGFTDIQYDGGRVYTELGQVVDPELMVRVGRLPSTGPVRSEAALNRVYVLGQSGGSWVLGAYDRTTLAVSGTLTIPGIVGTPSSLQRWGTNGLAFRTSGNQVFLIESDLVPQASASDLAIQQSSSMASVIAGAELTYTLNVTNKGPLPATGISVQDQLPPSTLYVSGFSTKGICEIKESVVFCQVGTLLTGESATLTITVRTTSTGTITNLVVVSGNEPDTKPADNTSVGVAIVVPGQSPTAVAEQLLAASDLTWHPGSQRIYATIRGNDPQFGNRLVKLDPLIGRVEAAYFVGSEPGRMAFSSDYRFLYVAVDGGERVRRFDLISQSADVTLEVDVGQLVDDMAPLNGIPGSMAFTRMIPDRSPSGIGLSLYDNAVLRFKSSVNYRIEAGEDSSVLYNYVPGSATYLLRFQVGSDGLTLDKAIQTQETFYGDFQYDAGLLLTAQSDVLYGPTLSKFGVLTNIPGSATARLIASDSAGGRVYHLTQNNQSADLRVFSRNRLELLGLSSIGGLNGTASSLIRWGSNGLAFCTTANQLFLLRNTQGPSTPGTDLVVTQITPAQTSFFQPFTCSVTVSNRGPSVAPDVILTDELPNGGAIVSASVSQGTWQQTNGQVSCALGSLLPGQTATLTLSLITHEAGTLKNGALVASAVGELNPLDNFSTVSLPSPFLANISLSANDIAFDPVHGKVMAAIGPGGGALSNSIVPVDISSGAVGPPIFMPDVPIRLAVSDDGQFLYAGLANTGGVWRVNLASNQIDLFFSLGGPAGARYRAGDIEVMPGYPHTIAVSVNDAGGNNVEVAIYDDGIVRSNTVAHRQQGNTYYIAFGTNISTLYCSLPAYLRKLNIDATGATLVSDTPNLAPSAQYDFQCDGGLIFFDSDREVDPVAKTIVTNFPAPQSLVAPDTANGQVYFVVGTGGGPYNWQLTLRSFDLVSTLELWSVPLPPVQGYAARFIRLGTNGLALITDAGHLFLAQNGQLRQPRADLSLTQVAQPTSTTVGAVSTCTFTIRNQGPFTATGVIFSNSVPSNALLLGVSTSQGAVLQTNPSILCSLGTISNGGAATVTITYQALTNGIILNQGFVSLAQDDPYPVDNSSATSIIVSGPPSLAIGDASVSEGNSGSPSMTFNLSLSAATPIPVYVGYQTADGTAIAGVDYNSKSGVFVLNSGTLGGQLVLSQLVRANTTVESNRFFYLNLTTVTNAVFARTQAVATILEDDFRLISATNVAVLEGNNGWTNLTINLRLAPASTTPVSVDYQTVAGTATAGLDYVPKAGSLIFPPGVTNISLNVPVVGDTLPEINEVFSLVLSQPDGAVLATQQVQGTIVNDDPVPQVAITGYQWSGVNLVLSFPTIAGRYYRIDRSQSLPASWTIVADRIPGTGGFVAITDTGAAQRPQGFYRLVLLP
jgi:uncharacterized repeat protein (TIGR01451 family)